MVRRCCIVTCRNGSFECDETVSFFKVPNDQSLFEKWANAVKQTDSELYKSSAICERHFREDQIKRETILRDSYGNITFQKTLASLTKEAVPSIFDNSEEQSLEKKKKKWNTVKSDHSDFLKTDNYIFNNEGNLNLNYSNILVSCNENENNVLQFHVTSHNSPSDLTLSTVKQTGENVYENSMDNINEALATNYFVNGHASIHNKDNNEWKHENNTKIIDNKKSIISIYFKSRNEEVKSNINNIENINKKYAYNSQGALLIDKEQIAQKIINQFNNYNELNLEIPKEVTIILPEDEIIILNENNNYAPSKNIQKNFPTKSEIIHYPLPETNIQMNIRSFDLIFYNSHKIKLPSCTWGFHKNNVDKDIIIFSKAKWFKSDVLIPPIYEKQVVFHESHNMKIYINNKFSPLEVRKPKDLQEMELILKDVDEIVVCCGGPYIGECDTAHCAQKDHAVNKWRHKLCPIILMPGESICKFCSTINQIMRYPKTKKFAFGKRSTIQ